MKDYTGLFGPVVQVTDAVYEKPTVRFKLRLRTLNELSQQERAAMEENMRLLWSGAQQAVVTMEIEFCDSAGRSLVSLGRVTGRGTIQQIGSIRDVEMTFADAAQAPDSTAVTKIKVTANIEPR